MHAAGGTRSPQALAGLGAVGGKPICAWALLLAHVQAARVAGRGGRRRAQVPGPAGLPGGGAPGNELPAPAPGAPARVEELRAGDKRPSAQASHWTMPLTRTL